MNSFRDLLKELKLKFNFYYLTILLFALKSLIHS